jgi:alkane 1-monooxygenase
MEKLQAPALDDAPLSASRVAILFAPHLLALLFPLNALAFVATGPHRWWASLLFLVPVFGSVWVDAKSGTEARQPAAKIPAWPFDVLLVALVAIQVANVALLARMFSTHGPLAERVVGAIAGMIAVGSSSGYSGIVVAHELIHRRGRAWVALGRLVLSTVMYEHFYTEHVRGHHVRVGTDEDPATARFGETFQRFYFRTVPAQFLSAWRLEKARLGDPSMRWHDPRLLRSRVLHGVLFECSLAAALALAFGPVALAVHLMQAWWATRALEVVNYFEHWGLRREGRRVLPVHSWDTHSRFTYFALTGLSRHADHHAFSARPYQLLRVWEESPKLPRGYLAMFPLVLGQNPRFQRLMTAELERRKLGPFAPAESDRSSSTVAA